MSRAVNIQATQEHIIETCGTKSFRITSIEPLASGGTRVVLSNSVESAQIVKLYGKKVIAGAVQRQPIRLQRGER